MARPKPQILLSKEISQEAGIDILSASSLYAVLYQDQPFNVKQRYYTLKSQLNKYPKTVFPSSAPAENLAKKLNEIFHTTDFAVTQIL
jgi:hypothetical protein